MSDPSGTMSVMEVTGSGEAAGKAALISHTGVPLTRATTFTFTLDPTPTQHAVLMSHAGAARLAFNHHVARVYANLSQRAAEKTYGLTGKDLTPGLSWSKVSFINHMNAWKTGRTPDAPTTTDADRGVVRGLAWRGEVCADVFECASVNAAQALDNWRQSLSGARKGPKVEAPRFKTRRGAVQAFRIRAKYREGEKPAVRDAGPRTLHIPFLGDIKVRETTRKLRRMLDGGRFHAYAAAFSYRAGRWQVAVTGIAAELHHAARSARSKHSKSVGVDVGIKTLAVAADTTGLVLHEWAGVKALQHAQERLAKANRALSRTKKGSRGNAKAKRRLGRAHARARNLRAALVHEITTILARSCTRVVIEDLNVAGMLKNHRLARSVADAAFGEIRRQLAYKTGWYGTEFVVADRWYPSSKTCSTCGHVKDRLPLGVRTYRCESCGMVLDRDVNAAINLARYIPLPEAEKALPLEAAA